EPTPASLGENAMKSTSDFSSPRAVLASWAAFAALLSKSNCCLVGAAIAVASPYGARMVTSKSSQVIWLLALLADHWAVRSISWVVVVSTVVGPVERPTTSMMPLPPESAHAISARALTLPEPPAAVQVTSTVMRQCVPEGRFSQIDVLVVSRTVVL